MHKNQTHSRKSRKLKLIHYFLRNVTFNVAVSPKSHEISYFQERILEATDFWQCSKAYQMKAPIQ